MPTKAPHPAIEATAVCRKLPAPQFGPDGKRGRELASCAQFLRIVRPHQGIHVTWTFHRKVLGQEGGETGVDDHFAARGFDNIGAWILGRNMFGPVRGPWPDETWRGWWGEEPPCHTPVFVLTDYSRPPLTCRGPPPSTS